MSIKYICKSSVLLKKLFGEGVSPSISTKIFTGRVPFSPDWKFRWNLTFNLKNLLNRELKLLENHCFSNVPFISHLDLQFDAWLLGLSLKIAAR